MGGHTQMKPKLSIFLLAFVLATLLVAGSFYAIDESAESRESFDLNLVELDLDPVSIAFLEHVPNSGTLLAQKNCGNETCSAEECCCLNIDTGAQCCRPRGNSASCIEACKKSKPC